MIKNIDKRVLLFLVSVQIIVITVSNFLVSLPLEIYGIKLTWSAFSFPIIVLSIDLTVRVLGKSIARITIAFSYPFAILSSVLVLLFDGLGEQDAYRIGFASATAYGISTLLDVYVFQYLRERYTYWWLAPSISTVFANIIDTFVFFFTAFSNSNDTFMAKNWIEIATNQSIIKITIGLILFLPFYGILLNLILKRINKNDS